MRITRVRPIVLGTPWRNLTFVVVETDEGIERRRRGADGQPHRRAGRLPRGGGAATMSSAPTRSTIEDLSSGCTAATMRAPARSRCPRSPSIEMACWDIMGKALGPAGLPAARRRGARQDQGLCQRLVHGRAHAGRVPRGGAARRSHAATARSSSTRSARASTSWSAARRCARSRWSRRCATRVGPDVEILIEMHGRFNPATAIEMARELARFQPGLGRGAGAAGKPAALKKVAGRGTTGIPVATGERMHTLHEFRELFELQAADIIQPDITHFGGHPGDQEDRRLGRHLLHAGRAAQRRRAGRHRGSAAPGGLHAQLQDSGALQRLRRGLGQGRRPRHGRGRGSTATSPCRTAPAWASS